MNTQEIHDTLKHGCKFDFADSAHLLSVLHSINNEIGILSKRLDYLESIVSARNVSQDTQELRDLIKAMNKQ